jgi:hypothetical protein
MAVPEVFDAPTLDRARNAVSGGSARGLVSSLLSFAAQGAAVAIGFIETAAERIRGHREEKVRSELSRAMAEDIQRAFERETLARPSGCTWLVHRPGRTESDTMTDVEFNRFREGVAASGGTLVTLVLRGGPSDMTATLTRYVAGKLHGTDEDCPAIVMASRDGLTRVYYDAGRVLQPACAPKPIGPPRT